MYGGFVVACGVYIGEGVVRRVADGVLLVDGKIPESVGKLGLPDVVLPDLASGLQASLQNQPALFPTKDTSLGAAQKTGLPGEPAGERVVDSVQLLVAFEELRVGLARLSVIVFIMILLFGVFSAVTLIRYWK